MAPCERCASVRVSIPKKQVYDAVFGCACSGEQEGGASARRPACWLAGARVAMSAVTINRFCASGLSAVNLGQPAGAPLGFVGAGRRRRDDVRLPMLAINHRMWVTRRWPARSASVPTRPRSPDLVTAPRLQPPIAIPCAARSHTRAARAPKQAWHCPWCL
ncbi:MAG: hypothetical protein IPG24_04450 [Leptospiraceae bacterium]|nr:hypothetical protein [Leptospiraceae bacterium]